MYTSDGGFVQNKYIMSRCDCQQKGGIMAQEILKPLLLDETGQEIVTALNAVVKQLAALNETLKAQNGGETTK